MSRIAVFVLSCVACSGAPPRSPGPAAPGPSTTPDAQTAAVPRERAECEAMVMHVAGLAAAEQGGAEVDRAAVRAGLEPFVVECSSLAPEVHRCALAATSLAEVAACQTTRSSSTSNSNVAPGGITPAAPRSP